MNTTSLFSWMLVSTLLLGAWWLCYRLALRDERGFAYNRAFLVLGPLLAAGLPLLPLGWPAAWGAGRAALAGLVGTVLLPAVEVSSLPGPVGVDWSFWLLAGYLSGAALLLLRLGHGLARLWLRTRALPREVGADYVLMRTHGRLPTSSFGRAVLWDETLPLSTTEARQVLRHELAHVRQGHTYDRLLLELLQVVLWFNPFVHLCGRALALTHEYLADEAALRPEAAAAPSASLANSYTHLLARQVAGRLGFSVPLAHSFSQSQTLSRIAMIQKNHPISRWKQWLALPLAAALCIIVACGQTAAQGTPAAPKPAATLRAGTPPPPSPVRVGETPPPSSPPVYIYVEHMPQLPGGGGNKAIVEFIQSHLTYPGVAPADRKEGRVFVSFVVAKDGKVQDINVVKGLAAQYDAAVVASVQQLPRFIPGTQNNQAVNVSFTVPITFAN